MQRADDQKHIALERAFALLTRALAEIEGSFLRTLSKAGVTEGLLSYLDRIGELGAPSLGELAASLGVSRPSASVAVKKLRGKDLVSAAPGAADRRCKILSLTSRGRALAIAHEASHHDLAKRFRRTLSAADVSVLEAILRRALAGRRARG